MAPSKEVQDAVGGAPLDDQITALETELNTPTERERKATLLGDLKKQKAEQEQQALVAEAKARVLTIVRTLGGLAEASKTDGARLVEAAHAYVQKAEVLDQRFTQMAKLKHAAQSLCTVFGLDVPSLPVVEPPARRADVQKAFGLVREVPAQDHDRIAATVEWAMTEHGLVPTSRRTFEELDTPDADLIRRKRTTT